MPGSQQQPQFDSEAFTLYSQENFYTPQDLECAAKDWPRAEVEKAFEAYRAAIAVGDHATMAAMLPKTDGAETRPTPSSTTVRPIKGSWRRAGSKSFRGSRTPLRRRADRACGFQLSLKSTRVDTMARMVHPLGLMPADGMRIGNFGYLFHTTAKYQCVK